MGEEMVGLKVPEVSINQLKKVKPEEKNHAEHT